METGDLTSLSPLSLSSSATPSQEDIAVFAEQYSLNLASKRFNVPIAAIKRWMKSSSVPLTAKYNSPGQGRKISYSADVELEMAEHIRDLLSRGERVTMQGVCAYARSRVQEEVPEFVASTGWASRFLARNNIDLFDQRDRRDTSTPQREGRGPDSRGRPLSYSVETDQAIANYVRQKLASGYSLTNSELRRYAKEIIVKENRRFTGSASWAQNFLHRHKINLQSGESKEAASTSPSPTVPSRVSPASPSTPLLSTTPLLTSQSQYPSPGLTSSPSFASATSGTDTSHLNPATEMHVVASSTPGFPNPALSDGVMGLPAEYATDDPIKQALAILVGENIDPSMLTAEQMATLQSTLSELTSDTVSLVELLSTAQQIQEQSGEQGAAATTHLIAHGLDSATSGLYLGLSSNSDVFGSGLTGAAATQVNPNTQAPTVLTPPRTTPTEVDQNHTSRPLSYAKETDMILAKWVQEQQAAGKKVTFASLRAYAKNLVSTENPNFNASVGWVTPFLLRHGLDLSVNKRKTPRKADSPHDMELDDEQSSLAVQSPSLHKQPPSSAHNIIQEEHPLTPEQMMVPLRVLTPTGTSEEPAMIPTPATTCSPTTLEGIRAVLEQGMQSLATECSPADQIQLAAHLQEQSLALSQGQTSLVPGGFPQEMQVQVNVENQSLVGDDPQSQRLRVLPQKYKQQREEDKFSVRKRVKGQRNRHRLSEKLDVVRLMREHNLAPHFVCRMLGIANSTLAGWIKLVQQKGAELEALSINKKRSNLSGQGRPLTYSKEKDEAIAQWVETQQKLGVQVMPAELAKYAQSVIREENHSFTASSGWAQKFLQRHGLQLAGKSSAVATGSVGSPGPSGVLMESGKSSPAAAVVQDQQEIPAAVQTEEVIAHEYSQDRPYPEETEKHLVTWAKENISTHGSLSLQELCRYAEKVVIPQNPMFVASLSWAFMFLYTNSIMLDPKPNVASVRSTPNSRKRTLDDSSSQLPQVNPESTPKRPCTDAVSEASISPSTGNLCEALLALSSQSQESGQSTATVQAVLQVALRALHQQQLQLQQQKQQEEVLQMQMDQQALEPAKEQAEQLQDQAQEQLEVQVESLVEEAAELVKGRASRESGSEEAASLPASASGDGGDKETVASPPKEKTAKGKGTAINMAPLASPEKEGSSNTYFGKSAREFSVEEKEEVVRYANATTLQKAAMKYGVAAPTVWRWRVELKLHQPKYSAMQKKYIIKFAETNSLKEAAQRYGITGKTISNWRKALQADGELSGDIPNLLTQDTQTDLTESGSGAGDSQSSEVMFHFVVDGGEVVEVSGTVGGGVVEATEGAVDPGPHEEPVAQATDEASGGNVPLEVTTDVDIENVGMEYDVVSSEGHVAKPRCTPEEKVHILQYALDHTIKEASQKFGVSPGTLYYWKRSRYSGKEGSKEQHSASQGPVGGGQRSAHSPKIPPVIQYSGAETSLLENDSEKTVVQPEQFIAGSGAVTSAADVQAATIQTLSQALAGMSPDTLQNLNPDLTLLQAVSTLLAGGAGEVGRGDGNKDGASKRRDSSSDGIASPTDVLVRPFPPQESAAASETEESANDRTKESGKGAVESQMEDTPHVVSEEVVAMGDSSDDACPEGRPTSKPAPGEKGGGGEGQESGSGSPTSAAGDEPTSAITSEGGAGSVGANDAPTSPEPGSENRMELTTSSRSAEIPLSQPVSSTGTSRGSLSTESKARRKTLSVSMKNTPNLEGSLP